MCTDKDSTLIKKRIDNELWRSYEWIVPELSDNDSHELREYIIVNPRYVYIRSGRFTHRVVDADGISHCVPAPGRYGCVLKWENPKETESVNF
jgi:hypothetical protein